MGNYLTFNFRRTFTAKISHLIFADRFNHVLCVL